MLNGGAYQRMNLSPKKRFRTVCQFPRMPCRTGHGEPDNNRRVMGRTTFQVRMLNRDLDLRGLGGGAASLKLVFVPLSNTANY